MPEISAKGSSATVTFDGTTITIKRTWKAQGGSGTGTYPVANLSGVELTMPSITSMTGRFTLVTGGGVQRRRDQGFGSARRDPLTVQFGAKHKAEFEALADAVRAAIAAPAAAAATGSTSLADQLAQLGRLRADGVLSDEEFAAAKARLLGADDPTPRDRTW